MNRKYPLFEERHTIDQDSGCWIWIGVRHVGVYGAYSEGGRSLKAHRVALEKKLGRELGADEMALHSCDNPQCVNPDHLRAGNAMDNARDKVLRGRCSDQWGSRNAAAKVNELEVRSIHALLARGARQIDIARTFGISRPAVSRIKSGANWPQLHPRLRTMSQ